jgi:hypothetical protein
MHLQNRLEEGYAAFTGLYYRKELESIGLIKEENAISDFFEQQSANRI